MAKKELIISTTDEWLKDNIHNEMAQKNLNDKVPWFYAPGFLLFWFALFFAVIIPVFNYLPDGLTIKEQDTNEGAFIAEYAQQILYKFNSIGPKVVGSYANENQTVQLILDELATIRNVMREDLFTLETDVQQVSGAYMHWSMVNMYQGLQNIVVKLSTRNSSSENYLLVNSHFDSKPGSPGTGDDGFMVIVMLEVLRQIAKSDKLFEHPIVFLFNGAEENPLQASHGFITQHKWAKNCRALINLDAAGSGGRDLLFQGGPKHPWLMSYYNKNVKHPFATTMAEEIFQSGVVPSDTDFRIFRDYGHVPGLDMAQVKNGFVYHTKFDNYDVIPRGALQSTGDNVLALVRAISNAGEMYDTEKHAEGHAVFYDYLGLFFLYYQETVSIIINCCIAVLAIALVCVSLWRIASVSFVSLGKTARCFGFIFGLHLLGFILAFGLPLLMAVIFDSGNRSLTWFTNSWLNIGLYICPSLFGLCAPTLFYYTFSKNDKIAQNYRLQFTLHAHCVILSILCIVLSAIGIRSAYLFMISLFFYSSTLLINLLSTLHDRRYYWTILHKIGQIMPFLYFCYLIHTFLVILMPMMGRNGTTLNPDFIISFLCALGSVMAMGFLIPLVNIFRYPRLILLSLAVITFIFSMIAITPVGFPYRPKTSVGRVNFLHVQRVFYEYDGAVSLNESGYLFDFQDRLMEHPLKDTNVNLTGLVDLHEDCANYMMCGMPFFNHRWSKARLHARWLPRKPVELPGTTTLELLSKTVNATASSVRYDFQLTGPTHMSLFVQPEDGVHINDWTFIRNMLDDVSTYQAPYHIYFSYGNDSSPLKFYIDLTKSDGIFNVPVFQLGVSGHFVNFDYKRDDAGEEFIESFPDFIHVMEWPSSYKRYIF